MDSIGTSTEAMEVLSDAQAGLQEVAENPGIIRNWCRIC